MTRINLIPTKELSDQHLLAEYRELPRVIKQEHIYIGDAPDKYVLGKGHVKWAVKHGNFCLSRYYYICEEMKYRGFKVNYPYEDLAKIAEDKQISLYSKTYFPTEDDIELSRNRIKEKLNMKLSWYKWSNRDKPNYVKL
jgi:deoxyribonuclease (pyrimidine dimer)